MNEFKKNIFKKRTENIVVPPYLFTAQISSPSATNSICLNSTPNNVFLQTITNPTDLTNGDILYTNSIGTIPVSGVSGQFYHLNINDLLWAGSNSSYVVQISNLGVISIDTICP